MFKKFLLLLLLLGFTLTIFAQQTDFYRTERTKVNDLIHTQLKVSFDFPKRFLYGEALIKAKPHFYPTRTLTLDAKAMIIHEVKVNNQPVSFNYENDEIVIDLGKEFTRNQDYQVFVKYTARPELVKQIGSEAITDAKGLYFIDPDETDNEKPTQIWTQGETESNSCWFPTIDSPNQKSTQEIYITIPDKFTTLSNGLLISKSKNPDGTRTDYWKMSKPHAPYLFFMGIGEYKIVNDKWKNIAVDYYVENQYENVAKDIFGKTPEMIQFFSDKFGYEYPWEKYSQIVGRDYVSGAMENTTCTLHDEGAYQKKGQLIDENTWESTIAHELSHHWFGDLVTTESWSNITVNESFATYAEYLWLEYKYGKDAADRHLYGDKQDYLLNNSFNKDLVRFHYTHREDVFDVVSYQKGSVILNMLRHELGDEAFFAGLDNFLTKNEYKTAEAQQLRLALEEVSGKDLNQFFNQWYYNNGHPKLTVSYDYDLNNKSVTVTIKQTDKIFDFPLKIDVYEAGKRIEHQEQVHQKVEKFTYKFQQKPDLINANADHILLCEITDEQKDIQNFIFQLNNAPHYEDKLEAINFLKDKQQNDLAFKAVLKTLQDPYEELRILALQNIDLAQNGRKEAIKVIEKMAVSDPKTKVQGVAIGILGKLLDKQYIPLFQRGVNSTSYSVISNSIIGLYELDNLLALNSLNSLSNEVKQDLATLLVQIYIKEKDESQMAFIAKNLMSLAFTNDANHQELFRKSFEWIGSSNNLQATSNLINDFVSNGIRYKSYGIDQISTMLLKNMLMLQQNSNNTNKETIVKNIKIGLSKLLQ